MDLRTWDIRVMKRTKAPTPLKRCRREKASLFNFRYNDEEREKIKAKADRFTYGNMSAWIKYAALELEPRPEDLESK